MLRYLMGYPQIFFRYLGPSMWFSNRINWIISEVQASKNFFFIFLASKQLQAALGSGIGTGSVFCLSFSNNVNSSKSTIIKKLCKSKNLSNHRVVIRKNPLQVTSDLQRVFLYDHSVIWQIFWFAKLFNDGGLTTIAIWEWLFLYYAKYKKVWHENSNMVFAQYSSCCFFLIGVYWVERNTCLVFVGFSAKLGQGPYETIFMSYTILLH